MSTDFGRRAALSAPNVGYLVEKVKETSILIDKATREKLETLCSPENIFPVAESVHETSSKSIHRRSEQLNISEKSLQRILHKDLGVVPYNIQLVQEFKPIDQAMSYHFAQ